jgi:plastocyanin
MKKSMIVWLIGGMLVVLLTACAGTTGPTSSSAASGTTVHMGQTSFVQSSITISKGSSFTLVNDTSSVHIISNGSWVNSTPQQKQEPGAPTVNQVQFSNSGQSQVIGPFTTAGTYHFYCKVHPNMNLTVVVQ